MSTPKVPTASDLVEYNPELVTALLAASKREVPSGLTGRGIVMVGGGRFLPSAYLAVKRIRSTGCTLPVELWYLGKAEMPGQFLPIFQELGVRLVDATEIGSKFGFHKLGGWECKPLAITYSNFAEALFIDSDNLVLQDPSFLFESQEYLSSGAIFWPDFPVVNDEYWRIKPEAFSILGLPPQRDIETESGQLVINKLRHWGALLTTVAMNQASDFFYTHCSYGDKDTFTLAWLLTESSFHRIKHAPALIKDMIRTHFAPDGSPLFEHGRKWVLPVEANRKIGSIPREEDCFKWLSEFSLHLYSQRI